MRSAHLKSFERPLTSTPTSIKIATIFAIITAFSLFSFVALASYTKTIRVPGAILPVSGYAELRASRPGSIENLLVRQGDPVIAGQPIVVISTDTSLAGGAPSSQQLLQYLSAQERALDDTLNVEGLALQQRLAEIEFDERRQKARLNEINSKLSLMAEQVRLAKDLLDRSASLAGRGFISETRINGLERELISAQLALGQASTEKADLVRGVNQLGIERQRAQVEVQKSRAQLSSSRAALGATKIDALLEKSITLVAPRDGIVASMVVSEGQAVTAGAYLLSIIPRDAKLQVELRMPSSAIGFVRSGQPVRLLYDAFPYETYGMAKGTISTVSRFPVIESGMPGSVEPSKTYLARVELNRQTVNAAGREWPLVPGMQTVAVVAIEERTILAWIFSPLAKVKEYLGY